jgi:preprotein translocase subunit YajC
MTMQSVCLVAMAGGNPQQQGGAAGLLGMFIPMILIFAVFYFMMIRPQQRKEKERQEMLKNVKTGDRIMFGAGLLGTISNTKDRTLMVKVAENVKIEIARGAVTRVLDKDDKGIEETN